MLVILMNYKTLLLNKVNWQNEGMMFDKKPDLMKVLSKISKFKLKLENELYIPWNCKG